MLCSDAIPFWGVIMLGYGNEMNIKRTVHGYARSGLACIMIEDQVCTGKGLDYYFFYDFCLVELFCGIAT